MLDVTREGPHLVAGQGGPQAAALACLSPWALIHWQAGLQLGKARSELGGRRVGPVECRAQACSICT